MAEAKKPMTAAEAGRLGGQSRSTRKLHALKKNLDKAHAAASKSEKVKRAARRNGRLGGPPRTPQSGPAAMADSTGASLRAIATSRLTGKGQATVPLPVRQKLHLEPGDTVIFEESKTGTVNIRKAEPLDLEFLSALEKTLSEWNSENDEKAYADL
jgi:AbrB family looped-hinge helix DNA binding protein